MFRLQSLPCVPGEFSNSNKSTTCSPCRANTYSSQQSSTSCTSCGLEQFSKPGAATCSPCAAGKYVVVSVGCQSCPSGWHSATPDSTACLQCGALKYSEDSVTGSSSCNNCGLGKFGTLKEPGTCIDCPVGTYQDGKGERECKKCGTDTYGSETGATANAQCEACDLDKSTGILEGQTNKFACLCQRNNYYQIVNKQKQIECLECPAGANCSFSIGVNISNVYPQPGYWRSNPQSTKFVTCSAVYTGKNKNKIAEERCCPTKGAESNKCANSLASISPSSWNRNDQCLTGYAGVLCGGCAENHVRVGFNCIYCEGGSDLGSVYGVLVGLGVICLFVTLVFLLCSKRVEAKATKGANLFGQLKIILMFVQILSSMPSVMDTAPWPDVFVEFAINLGLTFNLDFLSVFSISSCTLAVPFLEQFQVHMALPIVLYLGIQGANIIASFVRKSKDERQHRKEKVTKVLILVILLLYPSLATRVFQVLRCKSVNGVDGLVLAADYSVICGEAQHSINVAIACVFLCVYILGIPFGILILLKKHRSALHDETHPQHKEIEFEYGGLYTQYEKKFWVRMKAERNGCSIGMKSLFIFFLTCSFFYIFLFLF